MKLAKAVNLISELIQDWLGDPNDILSVLKSGRGMQKRRSEGCYVRGLDLPLVAGFEDEGRGYRSRMAGGLQKLEKGRNELSL